MSKRFIANESNVSITANKIVLNGNEVHHINVLRYKVGDNVYINEYQVKITSLNKDVLEGNIIGVLPKTGIPNVSITLIQSYLKSDKMDYVVQKAVELGVKNIIPVITKNTIVKMDDKDRIKKVERLSKIAKEAIGQCGRADMVNVDNVQDISKLDFSIYDLVLVCHEKSQVSLKETLKETKKAENIAVIIGPEGGLEDIEVEKIMQNKNAKDVSLGERILRAETASLSILSILDYEMN